MCGITGKVTRTDPVERELIVRMCRTIEHRGPDSRGVFVEPGVGLGVQRLAVIDLATGDQPVFNEDETIVVVLNGEIYNYVELRDELTRAGHHFRTLTDTEVIVHLYEQHGDACVQWLRGMFAFALWDRRSKRLLLARDRLGKKPLFYCHRDGALWFGSEPKSFLQDPAVPREVNYQAIDSFLQFGYVPDPLSAFAGVRKLPPAHTLSFGAGRCRVERYWSLSYNGNEHRASESETHELIRQQLLEATRLRLRSDVPVGAFLSGGVDSSAVVAAMARQASGRVRTFSIGFDVEAYDETRHARHVAELFDTEHHEFRVEARAVEILPRLVWHYGEPFADHSAIATFYLAEIARRHVTVALNGDGGDEAFAGYGRYVVHTLLNRFDRTPKALPRLAADVLDTLHPRFRSRTLRRLRTVARAMSVTADERYATTLAFFPEPERASLYTPELQRALGPADDRFAHALISDAFAGPDEGHGFVQRLLKVDVNTYLPGDLLVKMDIATMAHSLEVRSPLLDHVFMEMAASLPASAKLSGLRTKRIFKDALRPWFPGTFLDRKKMGFEVPVGEWFRGPLRALPREVLLDSRSLGRGIFRREALEQVIDGHMSGAQENGKRLWALLQLEMWFRTYIDSPPKGPIALDVG